MQIVLLSLYDTDAYGIRTLHAVLDQAGFEVTSFFFKRRQLDNEFESTFEGHSSDELNLLYSQIAALEPSIVGINVMSTFLDLACEVTREIKQRIDTLVVLGGIHPTIRPEQCIAVADVVCRGEGEHAIIELARAIDRGEKVTHIENLWFKDENDGHIVRNDLRPLIQDLDEVPFADYSSNRKYLVDGDEVSPVTFDEHVVWRFGGTAEESQEPPSPGFAVMNFMTARGCPFGCSYCANSILRDIYKDKGNYLRQRSVEPVIQELESKVASGFQGIIRFEDDIFALRPEWVSEFSKKYKERIGLPFGCYAHPKSTKKPVFEVLKSAGLVFVQLGIQSGSEKMRNTLFNRHDSNTDIARAAAILHDLEIPYSVDLLFENPFATEKDMRDTFDLLLTLPPPFDVNTHSLTFFPEYWLTNYALQEGLITEEDVEDRRKKSSVENRWNPHLDPKRDAKNLFWSCLCRVAGFGGLGMSKQELIRLSENRKLRNHPEPLLTVLSNLNAGTCQREEVPGFLRALLH